MPDLTLDLWLARCAAAYQEMADNVPAGKWRDLYSLKAREFAKWAHEAKLLERMAEDLVEMEALRHEEICQQTVVDLERIRKERRV